MAASRVLPSGAEAKRVIHDNDTGRLKDLLTAHPALVSWRDEDGHTLLFMATESFGDAGDDFREQSFTRLACAEILIDAGAEVERPVLENVIQARAHHMLAMLARKHALPPTIEYLAAIGNLDAIRRVFDAPGALQRTRDTLDRAFLNACRFQHKDVAAFLLDRMIELNRELGARIESGPGRTTFIDRLCEYTEEHGSPWQTYLYNEILQTVQRGDRVEFERWLQREPHLLGEQATELQVKMIERAVINNRASMIEALFDHDPAILRASPPPTSSAIAFAFTWSSHEPASILHELVWHENYESMQFLIDRGINLTTLDYRWNATAEGWARHAAKNDKLADFLASAARQR